MLTIKKLVAVGAVLLLFPAVAPAQDVYKEITEQRLEDLLKGMNIQFKKGDAGKGATWYDYEKVIGGTNLTLRLWNFGGKDLMVDVWLAKGDWESINKWNREVKFSRAHLRKTDKGDRTVLEWNLDLLGGVTDDTIKHFITSFDKEIVNWFNKGAQVAATEEETFVNVPPERLEKIFKDLKIEAKKTQGKGNNVFTYEFDRKDYKIRLTSFGGNDLMIQWLYPQGGAPLSKINEWNVKRSYVRALVYDGNGKQQAALESNLDCVGGCSDSIIRYFIETFDGEVKMFDEHLRK